ncbi:hypothetical protein ACFQVD_06275 [Streptosporangium amethystogenes subsp. fukuiense]|uniref:Uncharacterized protein n=1 Tax=Streptosporangium amethystogenes subsp. fukuiense TaxID=698418 RepID=A0ABW2SUQ9_9ACTN
MVCLFLQPDGGMFAGPPGPGARLDGGIAAARVSSDCLAVGESAVRSWAARAEEHTRLTTGTSVPAMAYPLVLDVTGTPEGLAVAVAATKEGGRVVVLGAPLPVGAVYGRGLPSPGRTSPPSPMTPRRSSPGSSSTTERVTFVLLFPEFGEMWNEYADRGVLPIPKALRGP